MRNNLRTAALMFARVFALRFGTLPSPSLARSHGVLPTLWDGTDPLSGGHQAAPGTRPGGAS